jgi:hypothetical protein
MPSWRSMLHCQLCSAGADGGVSDPDCGVGSQLASRHQIERVARRPRLVESARTDGTEAGFRGTCHKQLLDNDLFEAGCMLWTRVETRKWTKSATDYWKTICDVDKTALLDEVPGVSYIRRA